MKEIIAANLIRYRKSLGLSQEQLAEQIGITRQSINNYEKAKTLPDSKILSTLAKALGVTLDDILRSPGNGLSNFRVRGSISVDNNAPIATMVTRMLLSYNALEQAVGVPTYIPESTPCYQLEGNEKRIQEIASLFRHRLGLGDAPIANLFGSAEEIGFKVLRLSIPIQGFFSLSAISDYEGVFVLVNTHNVSIERQLFAFAHEIGHLIFHRVEYLDSLISEVSKKEEKAFFKVADYFASYLLVPQSEFERMYSLTQDIIKLKRHFRVSYLMILNRLAEMGVIDEYKEKARIAAIYKKPDGGASVQEDLELPPVLTRLEYPENERFEFLIWQSLKLGKISETKAAELLNLTYETLRLRRIENELYAIA
jgi:Zn-dependent peptidase ImmA (M78 family)/DNA-binding XRE family transcriptional regulator